jgi:hypothetical protein
MARFAALSERSACKIACAISSRGLRFQLMKGHEDGGTECSSDMEEALPLVAIRRPGRTALSALFLRKEVIQPQVPLRLPCYDFTPVAKPTVVACSHGVTGGVYKAWERIHRGMLIRDY